MASTTVDKTRSYFPLAGKSQDGWSNEDEATATCFCGAVQMSFPLKAPGFVNSFVCNCTDCHKVTASMFASNFTTLDSHTKHLRGEDNLTSYSQSTTIGAGERNGHSMTNYFCKTCGSLMYRVSSGFPGTRFMRIGSVDDFSLHETVLRPQVEQFTKDRASWLHGVDGAKKFDNMMMG